MNENYGAKLFASFVFGVVAVALVTRYYLKKEFEVYENDTQDYTDYLESQILEEPQGTDTDDEEDFEIQPGVFVRKSGLAEKKSLNETLLDRGIAPVNDTNLQPIVKNVFTAEEYPDDKFEDTVVERGDIYEIDFNSFNENIDEFEQLTLTYYEKDKVLTDENDEPVPHIANILGDVLDNRFVEGNVIYVRNENTSADYEVIIEEGSFVEIVLGYSNAEEAHPNRHAIQEKVPAKRGRPKKVDPDGQA